MSTDDAKLLLQIGDRENELRRVEENFGYVFNNIDLLIIALYHDSCTKSVRRKVKLREENFKEGAAFKGWQMEHIGDAIIALNVRLASVNLNIPPGGLDMSTILSNATMAHRASILGIRDKRASDKFEAVFGAMFMDGLKDPDEMFTLVVRAMGLNKFR